MPVRIGVITLCLLAAAVYLADASRAEEVPPRQQLANLDMSFDGWVGRREPDFAPEVMEVLGADDYIVRTYTQPGSLLGLYIGYHASQRQGDTIHSPLNCLPGAGWLPIEQSRTMIDVPQRPGATDPAAIEVNRVVIEKGPYRQLVYYWYQSHRRVVASEYWGKVYTVLDSVRYHRTDAAMVRVTAVIPERTDIREVDARTIKFVQSLFPRLSPYLPS